MNELVVLSGKGGTGKTSVVASLAALAGRQAVLADCDVDAADLHMILQPTVQRREEFYSGHLAIIRPERCTGCGACVEHCRFEAIRPADPSDRLGLPADASSVCRGCSYCVRSCPQRTNAEVRAVMESGGLDVTGAFRVDPQACEGCGVCVEVCPAGAIQFQPRRCGQWMVSDTRHGPMVHARLDIGAENSGKLVSTVRRMARQVAEQKGLPRIIIDGSPGIGCPVIASLSGADQVLIVTEPTVSGLHDLQRVAELANHFGMTAMLCVNKWDINAAMAEKIEAAGKQAGLTVLGRLRYDPTVTAAQLAGQSAVEFDAPCAGDIRRLWEQLQAAET